MPAQIERLQCVAILGEEARYMLVPAAVLAKTMHKANRRLDLGFWRPILRVKPDAVLRKDVALFTMHD
jgi:hypothetical protein